MMTLSAVTCSVDPSESATSIVFASTKVPRPSYSVTLFFFMRKWIPLTCVCATLRLRSCAAPKSNDTSPEMPKKSALWVNVCASSAFLRSDFEGMHPTLRHTPPQYFSSMIAAFRPSWEARTAAT